jgi:Plant specific mitochondrial import receptor subunit TOM20
MQHECSLNVETHVWPYLQKCFKDALKEQPENPIYKKGLEMTAKAPDLYEEIQRQISAPTTMPAKVAPRTMSNFWFDVLGYVTVIGAILSISALVSMMNPQVGGPPQSSGGK